MCNNTLATLTASTVNAIYNSCTHTDGSGVRSRGLLFTVVSLLINSCQPGRGLYYRTVAMPGPRKHCAIIIRTSKTLHLFRRFPGLILSVWNDLPLPLFSPLLVNLNTSGFILPRRCLFYNKRSSSFVGRHKRDHRWGWGQTIRQTDKWTDGHTVGMAGATGWRSECRWDEKERRDKKAR